jgi:hypothetical protein
MAGPGLVGRSSDSDGVQGFCTTPQHAGVTAINDSGGYGVWARSTSAAGGDVNTQVAGRFQGVGDSEGIRAISGKNSAIVAKSASGTGVWGQSESGTAVLGQGGWNGVQGTTANSGASGVWGENTGSGNGVGGKSAHGVGVYGTGSPAGRFEGDVVVTGDVQLAGGDCAEEFDIANADRIEPGTVMVLGEDGRLEQSQFAYDKRVAGVISGAGDYKPGIVLDKQKNQSNRRPVALLGKVYCKVDANYSPIQIGDLLTTSPTPAHAMKANDPIKAFGAIIGKAMRPLAGGQSLIPVLVALQ